MDISKIKKYTIAGMQNITGNPVDPIILEQEIDEIAKIEALSWIRPQADSLLCLLPSAQASNSARQIPIFHRWSWAKHFPKTHILCLSDPGLYYSDVHAAWFQSPNDIDIFERLAKFIKIIANNLEVSGEKITIYGSSMGGFGALMVGTMIKNSLVIAEVPQIDLRQYPVKAAINSIELNYFLENPLMRIIWIIRGELILSIE